jgi:hypothetical protein
MWQIIMWFVLVRALNILSLQALDIMTPISSNIIIILLLLYYTYYYYHHHYHYHYHHHPYYAGYTKLQI